MKKTPPYTIVYEDENIVAVNKASGIPVCADRWEPSQARLDAMLREDLGATILRVHRIDKGSSGLVVFAKNTGTHKKLCLDFEKRNITKSYIAAVHGKVMWDETSCDLPLLPDGNKNHLTIVDKYRGKQTLTRFKYLCGTSAISVLAVFPMTGRQHQIRVHLAKMGHPIVCDALYGTANPLYLSKIKRSWRGDRLEEKPLITRLALHSETLGIHDYFTELQENSTKDLVLSAPLHKDMSALINQIRLRKCVMPHK
ncbi:MAG: RluA family pseudouridine synthase [Spirochaetaceae bacterium]|jgi:RluA family pseudouridine synthase|nr:RluA family pseudouridine synthase [Spirochaetaceae bacterium]